ncbi:MAG: hypothetical protein K0M47_04465 [Rhizobium sp.]|nr:hypothetical protein [Rhizobium sp.]
MAYQSSIQPQQPNASRLSFEKPELIDRLAEKLRATSDVDLPHSYFVEQVRLGLAGRDLADLAAANHIEGASRQPPPQVSGSVFRAWAMPD